MQREIFSHYFYNGFTVACGVIAIGLGGALIGGASLAAGLAMGAICVSIADVPTPARHKFFEILFSLLLGTLVIFAVGMSRGHAEWLFVAIAATSFVAALITAYGKKAMPLSFALFFTLVLTLGQPAHTLSQVLQHSGLFALGGGIYLIYSVLVARLLDFRTRQQGLGECLQALADYLRVQADFFDPKVPLADCYAALIGQQGLLPSACRRPATWCSGNCVLATMACSPRHFLQRSTCSSTCSPVIPISRSCASVTPVPTCCCFFAIYR
jgi:hypothetical protein